MLHQSPASDEIVDNLWDWCRYAFAHNKLLKILLCGIWLGLFLSQKTYPDWYKEKKQTLASHYICLGNWCIQGCIFRPGWTQETFSDFGLRSWAASSHITARWPPAAPSLSSWSLASPEKMSLVSSVAAAEVLAWVSLAQLAWCAHPWTSHGCLWAREVGLASPNPQG